MSFLAIGDWGGDGDVFPTAKGEVDNNEAMGTVATALKDVKFVLAMGDNFYYTGIQGDEHSTRFAATFEDVFHHPALDLPWYVVAGNHDHYGNVSAQIAYTQESPSKRWKFPSLYYTFSDSFTGDSGKTMKVQVIYLDSYILSGMSYRDEVTGEFVKGTGPPDQQAADDQMTWLEGELKASTADYLFVSAHYPIYSQCMHGPTAELVSDVLPLLQQHNVTAFLAGHDHCLGHFEEKGIFFTLSGAGKECCYKPWHINSLPEGITKFQMDGEHTFGADGGFASLTMNETAVRVTYYDAAGKSLYASKGFPPRK